MSTIKNPDVITILATGGTIDKFYSVAGTLDIGKPAAHDVLSRVLTDIRFDIRALIGKDSLDMTDEDRAELVAALNAVEHDERIRPIHRRARRSGIKGCGADRCHAASGHGTFGCGVQPGGCDFRA